MEKIDNMLALIPHFADESAIAELRTAIVRRFPPNINAEFDLGLDRLCALFRGLL